MKIAADIVMRAKIARELVIGPNDGDDMTREERELSLLAGELADEVVRLRELVNKYRGGVAALRHVVDGVFPKEP